MKTHRQKLFDYFAQEHNIQIMDSDYNELDNYAAAVEAEKMVIKAKALRKKGTDLWYYYHTGDYIFYESSFPDLFDGVGCNECLPPDAELIDIEISYQPEGRAK